jgi:hypothetical protein
MLEPPIPQRLFSANSLDVDILIVRSFTHPTFCIMHAIEIVALKEKK